MFGQVGIGLEDLEEIDRCQFVYYVTMERTLSDPDDWPRFRADLLEALASAFALDAVCVNNDPAVERERNCQRRARALELLDDVRRRHDPTRDWTGFFDALWEGRGPLLEDG